MAYPAAVGPIVSPVQSHMPLLAASAGFPVANVRGLLQNTAVPQVYISLSTAQKTALPAPVDNAPRSPSMCVDRCSQDASLIMPTSKTVVEPLL